MASEMFCGFLFGFSTVMLLKFICYEFVLHLGYTYLVTVKLNCDFSEDILQRDVSVQALSAPNAIIKALDRISKTNALSRIKSISIKKIES